LISYTQELLNHSDQIVQLVGDWKVVGKVTVFVSCCLVGGKGLKVILNWFKSHSEPEEPSKESPYDDDSLKKNTKTRLRHVSHGPADPLHKDLLFAKLNEKINKMHELKDEIHRAERTIRMSKEDLAAVKQRVRREGELRKDCESAVAIIQKKLDKEKKKADQHEAEMQALSTELSYYELEIQLRKEGLNHEITQKIQLLEASEAKQKNCIQRLKQIQTQELKKRMEERELTMQLEQKRRQLRNEYEKLSAKMEVLSYQSSSQPNSPTLSTEPSVQEDEEPRKIVLDEDEEGLCKRFLMRIKEDDHNREHF